MIKYLIKIFVQFCVENVNLFDINKIRLKNLSITVNIVFDDAINLAYVNLFFVSIYDSVNTKFIIIIWKETDENSMNCKNS